MAYVVQKINMIIIFFKTSGKYQVRHDVLEGDADGADDRQQEHGAVSPGARKAGRLISAVTPELPS